MDTKSLAKSKRAHSQHHQNKRTHPNPKSKPQSSFTSPSDSNTKKPLGKQIGEKSRKFQGLPSNWDRYEDEFDSSLEVGSIDRISQASDVLVPKSKGADFVHLISEAQSQLQSQSSANLGSFPSFDDVLPDFNQGISSMLSVRGNSILSWSGDDNFIVDDNSTTNDEGSYLSMDLHSLASKLEKLDVSQRLFIEADILPPEMQAHGSEETIKPESEQAETCTSETAEHCLDKFAFLGQSDVEKSVHHSGKVTPNTAVSCDSLLQNAPQGTKLVDQVSEALSFTTTRSGSSDPSFLSEGTTSINPVKDDSKQLEQSVLGEIVDSTAQFNVNDVADSREEKSATFEAFAAEAELDMLLNSFGETKLDFSDINKKSVNNLPNAQWDVSTSLPERDPLVNASKQPSGSSRGVPMNVNIDDTIDDLLGETSNLTKQKNAVHTQEVFMPPHVPTSSSQTTSLLDDLDSWLDTI